MDFPDTKPVEYGVNTWIPPDSNTARNPRKTAGFRKERWLKRMGKQPLRICSFSKPGVSLEGGPKTALVFLVVSLENKEGSPQKTTPGLMPTNKPAEKKAEGWRRTKRPSTPCGAPSASPGASLRSALEGIIIPSSSQPPPPSSSSHPPPPPSSSSHPPPPTPSSSHPPLLLLPPSPPPTPLLPPPSRKGGERQKQD